MPSLELELDLRRRGYNTIAGVDEAGRGAIAGPVVAGAVILPATLSTTDEWTHAIDDSKKLAPARRVEALTDIKRHALAIGVGLAAPAEIDAIGIGAATRLAMTRAVRSLAITPQYLLVDYIARAKFSVDFQTIIRGDAQSLSIACASIVAKVARDRLMERANCRFPGYNFQRHKGYGVQAHLESLNELGPSPCHRATFRPVWQAAILHAGRAA